MGSSGKPPGTPAEIPSTPSYHLQSHTPSSVNLLLEGLVSRTCWQKHAASRAKQPPGRDLFPRGGWKIGSVGHRRGTCGPHTPSWKESPARSCKIQPRWSCLHLPVESLNWQLYRERTTGDGVHPDGRAHERWIHRSDGFSLCGCGASLRSH